KPGSASINVRMPSISIATDAPAVGLTRTIGGTLTLSQPAPAGGTAVNLVAAPNGILSLQPSPVNIAPGSTTGAFPITGASVGSASIDASSTGYGSGTANVAVVMSGTIVLPSNVTVGPNQSVPFPVSLVTPAPVGGVTISLTSSDLSKATITPPSVIILQ